MFGLRWTGHLHAQVVGDIVRVAGEICFQSSGLACEFELTMPAGTDTSSPHATACVRLPLSPAQARSPAWIAGAVDALGGRAARITVLPDAAGGHIVLRNRVGLRRCQGVKEPSRELLHALTDATTDMARELLAIGDDWELTCARLRQARKQE